MNGKITINGIVFKYSRIGSLARLLKGLYPAFYGEYEC